MKGSRRALSHSRPVGWSFRSVTSIDSGDRIRSKHRNRFKCSWTSPGSVLMDRVPMQSQLSLSTRKFSSLPPGESKPKAVDKSTQMGTPSTLLYVVREAEEVLHLSSVARQEKKNSSEEILPENANAASYAANRLLLATPLLSGNILKPKSSCPTTHSTTIHRAFLTAISWCLDEIERNGNSEQNSVEESSAQPHVLEKNVTNGTLQSVVALARRAHELSLPLHLPLYQRLMETISTFAKEYDSINSTASVPLILEVSSWVAATLDAQVDTGLFRSSLCRLVRDGRLSHVRRLLDGMKTDHKIEYVDVRTAIDLLVAMKRMKSAAINMSDVAELELALEESLFESLVKDKEGNDMEIDKIEEVLKVNLQSLTEDEFTFLMDFLGRVWSLLDSVIDDARNDKNGSDSEDDRVLRRVLSRCQKSKMGLKSMLLDLIKGLRTPAQSKREVPKGVQKIASFSDKEKNLSFEAYVINTMQDEEEEKWKEEDDRILLGDLIYSPTPLDLPDVTYQVQQLIGQKEVKFSKKFEEILCMRDHDEDLELLGSLDDTEFEENDSDDSDGDIDSDDGF